MSRSEISQPALTSQHPVPWQAGRQAGTELMLAEHILSNKLECDRSTRVGITPAWHSRQLSVAPRKNASSLLWDNESSP